MGGATRTEDRVRYYRSPYGQQRPFVQPPHHHGGPQGDDWCQEGGGEEENIEATARVSVGLFSLNTAFRQVKVTQLCLHAPFSRCALSNIIRRNQGTTNQKGFQRPIPFPELYTQYTGKPYPAAAGVDASDAANAQEGAAPEEAGATMKAGVNVTLTLPAENLNQSIATGTIFCK